MTHGSFYAPFPSNIAVDVDFLHSAGYNKVCAYDLGEEIILRLRVSRALGVTDCRLVVFDEYSSRVKDKVQGEFFGIDGYDVSFGKCHCSVVCRTLCYAF